MAATSTAAAAAVDNDVRMLLCPCDHSLVFQQREAWEKIYGMKKMDCAS